MPPAFALSQDQTLKFIRSNASIPATPLRIARPSASELRHHSLQISLARNRSRLQPRYSLTSSPGRPRSQVHQQALRLQTSPCSSARTPATHPSPKVHPAATLRPPQHPHRFKHAAQRPTSPHASLLQITPRPTQVTQHNPPDHPGKTARSINSKTPIRISRNKTKPVGRTSALRKTPSPGASLPVNIQPVGRKPAAEAPLSASPPVNGLIRAVDWTVKPRGADSFQISCTPPVAPPQPLLARRLRRR